jgi:nitric oxide reductase large subunit
LTCHYLHRAAELTTAYYGGSASDTARQQTITDFKTNRFDAATGVLTISAAQADAFQQMTAYYAHHEIRSAAQCHHRSATNPSTHGFFQLVGLGWVHVATGEKLFLHE